MHDQGQGLSSPNSQEDGVLRALGTETKGESSGGKNSWALGKEQNRLGGWGLLKEWLNHVAVTACSATVIPSTSPELQ